MSTENKIIKRVTRDFGEFLITVSVFHGINGTNDIDVKLDFIANRVLFACANKKGEITINETTKHFSTNFLNESGCYLSKGEKKLLGRFHTIKGENNIIVKVKFNAEVLVEGRYNGQVFPEDEGWINIRISDDGEIVFYTFTPLDEYETIDTSRTNTQNTITLDSNSLNVAVMESALHAVGVKTRNEDKTLRKFTNVFVDLIEKWDKSAETK
ncbi:MAG: hypothetical protein [Bacteriophage sp.]|nr:MAG: hypothetical protein [Bacteriophage sp.]